MPSTRRPLRRAAFTAVESVALGRDPLIVELSTESDAAFVAGGPT